MTEDKREKEMKERVSTMLFPVEKRWLKLLAEENSRSMSSYLRWLLLEAIEDNSD